MFIPNGSLLYNTEDKRLYLVDNITYQDANDNTITRAKEEWVPGKALGTYTFNLVPKEYMFGYRLDNDPAVFENVGNFATQETAIKLTKKLQIVFPRVTFAWLGNVDNPKVAKDRVLLVAQTDSKQLETGEPLGYYAIIEAQSGTQTMLAYIRVWLMSVGMI